MSTLRWSWCKLLKQPERAKLNAVFFLPPPYEQNWASENAMNTMWMNQCFCVKKKKKNLLFSSNKLRASVLFLLRQCDFYKKNNNQLYFDILVIGPSLVWVSSGRDQCNTSLWASECTLQWEVQIPVNYQPKCSSQNGFKGSSVFGFDPVCGWHEKITW